MNEFGTYTGWGHDALLRTTFVRRREARPKDWNPEWGSCFSMSALEPDSIRSAYRRVMEAFSEDIGVHAAFSVPSSGKPPINVRQVKDGLYLPSSGHTTAGHVFSLRQGQWCRCVPLTSNVEDLLLS